MDRLSSATIGKSTSKFSLPVFSIFATEPADQPDSRILLWMRYWTCHRPPGRANIVVPPTNAHGTDMGTTAEYVMGSKQEMERLLDGRAPRFADDLYDERLPDDELLSLAVSGGTLCPGQNTHETTYLTVEQTRAIADVLTPLTSQELARKHHLSESEDSYDFYQFKKFYLRAASLEAGVLVYFG